VAPCPFPTTDGHSNDLFFDYCVVAVGVSNGFWKPRLPGAMASTGTSVTDALDGTIETNEATLEARRRNIWKLRERLARANGAVVVGAGLVGVELAAELAHFFPRLAVTLVDGSPKVLPQLAESAQTYARNYLQHHGVRMRLGAPFSHDSVPEGHIVLSCVGARPRSDGLFPDLSTLTPKGQIRVNRHMQVLQRVGMPISTQAPIETPINTQVPTELEPVGQGRVFAVGDAASVEGVPTAQMIFHCEEMAAVAVAGIEAAEGVSSPLSVGRAKLEAESGLPLLCNTSLGPLDGMFSTQSELLATGTLAALQKQVIEATKMSALRGELLGSLLWMPVH